MKFQIPNIHHSKVNRRTHAHTHRQTDRQTDKPKAICPSNFFKVGGINYTCCLQDEHIVIKMFHSNISVIMGTHNSSTYISVNYIHITLACL